MISDIGFHLTAEPQWKGAIFSGNVNSHNAVEAPNIQFLEVKQVQQRCGKDVSAENKTESKTRTRAGQDQDPNPKQKPQNCEKEERFSRRCGQRLAAKHLLTVFPFKVLAET